MSQPLLFATLGSSATLSQEAKRSHRAAVRPLESVLKFPQMADLNGFARVVSTVEHVPRLLRTRARSLLIGRIVKFVGTARLEIEELTKQRAIVSIKNRSIVQNHIGGIHAAAMALLAESATGFVVGMNVPDDRVPVIKTIKIDFLKRARGGLHATAELTPDQVEAITTTEKGEVNVKVSVTDDTGIEPIACEMIWAWTPKRR